MKKNIIPVYHIDAFTDKIFKGNPAAVCLLNKKYPDRILQGIASEMNLSETAFVLPLEKKPIKQLDTFSLRWFTPKVEVPLCGHATLSAAAILFYDKKIITDKINFKTLSGNLTCKKLKESILLDFPAAKTEPLKPSLQLLKTIGITKYKNIVYSDERKTLLVHLDDASSVKVLLPNFELMKQIKVRKYICGVIVTSKGNKPYDFISRFFAPLLGVNEDPVTGSAHTILAPYWSKILGKQEMSAYQASVRGGALIVRTAPNNRVYLIGKAIIVAKGELYI